MAEPTLFPRTPDTPRSHPHPGWILTAAVDGARTLVWALIPLLFSVRDRGALVMVATTAIFGLAVIIWRAIQWRHIWFSAQDGSISVESGVLDKSHKSVRTERVQSVDSIETPISRALGISELRISTAGSTEPLTIPAISGEAASQLRAWIGDRKAEIAPEASTESDVEPIVEDSLTLIRRMSGKEVLLAGLTSGRIAPAVAIVALAFRFATEILPESALDRVPVDPDRLTPGSIAIIVVVGAVLVWGISILGAILTLWDFTLQRSAESIVVTSGLLDRKQNTIAIQRIQGITIVDSIPRQPFGYASIVIESAAPQQFTEEAGDARHLFPFLPRNEAPALIQTAIPELGWITNDRNWTGLPARARPRYLIPVIRDYGLLTLIACVALWRLPFGEWWYGLALLLLIPFALAIAELQFRDAGWSREPGDNLVVRTRALDRTTTFTNGRRVQIREVSQNWLQRRVDLSTISLFTSSRGSQSQISIRHADLESASELLSSLAPEPGSPSAQIILPTSTQSQPT